uniref:Uncharacterized protein n=1 Tax=Arundo donax TaxID=35708 RepID=A0A0A8ZH06_ARUDO
MWEASRFIATRRQQNRVPNKARSNKAKAKAASATTRERGTV